MLLTNLDLPPPKRWIELQPFWRLCWVTVEKDDGLFVLNYPSDRLTQWPYQRSEVYHLIYYAKWRLTYFEVNSKTYLRYIREPANKFQVHLRWNQLHKRFSQIK